MRAVLSIALAVVFAGTVQAQERAVEEPVGASQAAEVQTAPVPANASVTNDAQQSSGDAATVQPASEQRAAEAPVVRQTGPESRSWWYLVGAIVLAGIILVAIT